MATTTVLRDPEARIGAVVLAIIAIFFPLGSALRAANAASRIEFLLPAVIMFAVAARLWFTRVEVDESGVLAVNLFQTRRFRWDEIAAVGTGYLLIRRVVALILHDGSMFKLWATQNGDTVEHSEQVLKGLHSERVPSSDQLLVAADSGSSTLKQTLNLGIALAILSGQAILLWRTVSVWVGIVAFVATAPGYIWLARRGRR